MSSHLKLHVFHRAADVAVKVEVYACKAARHRTDLGDQVRRASASVALNIAEGASETRRREKARFYRMARRSADETDGAIFLIERMFGQTAEGTELRAELHEISAMLTAMIERNSSGERGRR